MKNRLDTLDKNEDISFYRAKADVTLDLGAGLEAVFRIEGQLAVIEFPNRTTKDVPLNELSNEFEARRLLLVP